MKMKICNVLWAVLGVLVSCFASPALFACNQPTNLGHAFPAWAPNAIIQINLGGTPSSPEQAAANAWDNSILNNYNCGPYFITSGGFTPTATINMTFGSISASTSPGDDDNVWTSTTTTVTRGVTDFSHATTSGGYLSTIPIQINSQITASAAIQEVVAHELGHTLNLSDCNYPGCPVNSSVMESGVNAPGTTINSVIGQPGPTLCDISAVGLTNNYFCATTPTPCPGYCSPAMETTDTTTPSDWCTYPDTGCAGQGYFDDGGCCAAPTSPILIDTTGGGFYLTSTAGGVLFDISGTGHPVQMGWTAASSSNAFLVLPGADGLVHNGKQLFGNYTTQPASKTPNGFAALAIYDLPANGGNGDGIIDSRDAIFTSLRLWIDANHDGIATLDELHTLPSLGVTSISLTYRQDQRTDQFGNVFRYRAQVNPGDTTNTGRMAYDVFFVRLRLPPPTTKNLLPGLPGLIPADARKCALPVLTKGGMLSTTSSLR